MIKVNKLNKSLFFVFLTSSVVTLIFGVLCSMVPEWYIAPSIYAAIFATSFFTSYFVWLTYFCGRDKK